MHDSQRALISYITSHILSYQRLPKYFLSDFRQYAKSEIKPDSWRTACPLIPLVFKLLSLLSGYIQDVLFRWWRQTRAGGWGQRSLTVARTHHPRAHQVRDAEKERFTAAEFFTGRREGPAGTSHYLKVMRFHTWRTMWHDKVCPPDLLDPIWWSRGEQAVRIW